MATMSVLLLLLSAFSPPVFTAFHVIPGNMNQTEARAACRGNYTDLVTAYSEEDNTELVNIMMEAGISDSWIGLYRNQYSTKWSNGDPVTINDLTGTCQNAWTCCAAMKADGDWECLQCTVTRNFTCYEQNISSQTPIYHLVLENKTWLEAQSYCRRNYTDLVSIRDQQQNEEVKNNGLNSTNPFWIGLLCDDWQWTDGGNSAYRKWASSEPQPSSKDCVVLSGGNWSTVQCSEKHSALCYWSFLHVSNFTMPWENVLDYCTEENRAGVLIISSADEQEDVESELRKRNISEPVWVGLRQSRLFGFWIWVDGTAVYPYSNWYGGKQPEGPVSQQCGAVVPPDYTWRDMSCPAHYRALCYTKCPS